jgi:hypothetical protein
MPQRRKLSINRLKSVACHAAVILQIIPCIGVGKLHSIHSGGPISAKEFTNQGKESKNKLTHTSFMVGWEDSGNKLDEKTKAPRKALRNSGKTFVESALCIVNSNIALPLSQPSVNESVSPHSEWSHLGNLILFPSLFETAGSLQIRL